MIQKIKNKEKQNWRINLLIVFIFLIAGAIILKLFNLQILKYAYYTALAEGQHQIFEDLIPERGKIYVEDKKTGSLFPLATNQKLNLVYAVPKQINNQKDAAQKLAPLLEIKEEELISKFSLQNDLYEPLKHKVTDEVIDKIKELNIAGINSQPENWRYYPEKDLAAHVLGFVGFINDEKRGQYGVEGYYETRLKGSSGFLEADKDALGRWISIGEKSIKPAKDGDSLVLTLDRTIQFKAEKILREGVEKYRAESGNIIVMDPETGEIIALASYPSFDPNKYSEVKDINIFNNSAIYSLYEPGSAFKPIIMAAALNSGLVTPNTTFEDNGSIKVDKYTIRNSDNKANGIVTMIQVLEKSINTGMVWVAQKLGVDRVYDYISRFGFTEMTGIDLDMEIPANIRSSKNWSEADLATSGFGQGLAITPMQLITATSAIANGGKLIQPHVVKRIIHSDGTEEKISSKEIRQVISPGVAATLTAMLTSVVENGHGKLASVPGYRIAGKTGTAQIPNKNKAGYDPNRKIASFIGFGPIDDPKFIALIKLDDPKGDVWGANTAAPMFGTLAKEILTYYQIAPEAK